MSVPFNNHVKLEKLKGLCQMSPRSFTDSKIICSPQPYRIAQTIWISRDFMMFVPYSPRVV